MEDIRKLLSDHDSEIAPESLAYILRGLNAAIADQLADCQPDRKLPLNLKRAKGELLPYLANGGSQCASPSFQSTR